MLRQLSIQAVTLILLAVFNQVSTENQEQKAHLKSFQFYQKGNTCEIGEKESLAAREEH